MITSLEGTLAGVGVDWADISVGGVTLRASVPPSTIERLGQPGDRTRLFTSLQTRDDNLTLFGFLSPEERSAFQALIQVNGVGPRLALSVLSSLSPESLAVAVASGDATSFKGIHGVGPRTAERIILELKGKLGAELAVATGQPGEADVVKALTALGYTIVEVTDAVASLQPDGDMSLEDKVRLCIQRIGSPQ